MIFHLFYETLYQYGDAVVWKFVLGYFSDSYSFKQFYRKVKTDPTFREIRFTSLFALF